MTVFISHITLTRTVLTVLVSGSLLTNTVLTDFISGRSVYVSGLLEQLQLYSSVSCIYD